MRSYVGAQLDEGNVVKVVNIICQVKTMASSVGYENYHEASQDYDSSEFSRIYRTNRGSENF